DHNCTTAGGHLDPDGFGVEGYVCDPKQKDKCEVGDLSGKYGALEPKKDGYVYEDIYDYFLKWDGPAGITGRSIVIHLSDVNKTRYDCANIITKKYKRF
ncbi:15087_t:CDS:2, partial [Funneliformis caledonium]